MRCHTLSSGLPYDEPSTVHNPTIVTQQAYTWKKEFIYSTEHYCSIQNNVRCMYFVSVGHRQVFCGSQLSTRSHSHMCCTCMQNADKNQHWIGFKLNPRDPNALETEWCAEEKKCVFWHASTPNNVDNVSFLGCLSIGYVHLEKRICKDAIFRAPILTIQSPPPPNCCSRLSFIQTLYWPSATCFVHCD